MKKTSILARLGVLAIALTVATSSAMSGTLAKYMTKVNARAVVNVASWYTGNNVKFVWGEDYDVSADFNDTTAFASMNAVNLADTMLDTPTTMTSGVIAPGTTGTFDIVVNTGSTGVDVDSLCYVYLKKGPNNGSADIKNLQIKVYSKPTQNGAKTPISQLDNSSYDSTKGWTLVNGQEIEKGNNKALYLQVDWEWPYGDAEAYSIGTSDASDTTNGSAVNALGNNNYGYEVNTVLVQKKEPTT